MGFIYNFVSSILPFSFLNNSGNCTLVMSCSVTGILFSVISGSIFMSTADKSVTIAANKLTIKDECKRSSSPIMIPVIAPRRAAPEQSPVHVVL